MLQVKQYGSSGVSTLSSRNSDGRLLNLKENHDKATRCPAIKGETQWNTKLDATAYLQGKRGKDVPFVCLHCMGVIL